MNAKSSLRVLTCAVLLAGCAQYASAQFINLGFEDGPPSNYPYTVAGWTDTFNSSKYQLRTTRSAPDLLPGSTNSPAWVYSGEYGALVILYAGGASAGDVNFLTSVSYNVADIVGMVPGASQIDFKASVRPWQYSEAAGHWGAYAAITFYDASGAVIGIEKTNTVVAQSTAAWHEVAATILVPNGAASFTISGSAHFDRNLVGNSFVGYDDFRLSVQPVPEPATVTLLAAVAAAVGVGLSRRGKRKAA